MRSRLQSVSNRWGRHQRCGRGRNRLLAPRRGLLRWHLGWLVRPERDDELIEWTREFQAAMTSSANGRVYTNYLDRDESDRARAAYRDNYDRLVDRKTEWDHANVFGPDIEPEA